MTVMTRHAIAILAAILAALPSSATASPDPRAAEPNPADSSAIAELQRESRVLAPLLHSKLARAFVEATARLPHIAPRTILCDSARSHFWWADEAAALPDTTRARLLTRTLDERFYYTTRYGSPLAYARPLELLAGAGFTSVSGKRIADFGYGTVGHLRLLASLGAEVTGIEVDPLLDKLYSAPGDQGPVASAGGRSGHIQLVHGSFPGDTAVSAAVGEGFDLFISKNTLKNGYIHPAQPVNPRMLVHLGVDDTTYVRAIRRALVPGGLAMIYNLCPAPAPPGATYIPWADGRCPFSRALWEAEGFDVLEFDRDDSAAARAMGHALGWDRGSSPMDLAKDLFATWTLVRKRARGARSFPP